MGSIVLGTKVERNADKSLVLPSEPPDFSRSYVQGTYLEESLLAAMKRYVSSTIFVFYGSDRVMYIPGFTYFSPLIDNSTTQLMPKFNIKEKD